MIYRIGYPRFGRFFSVPCGAAEKYMTQADGDQWKVLLCLLCSDGDCADTAELAARAGVSETSAEDALIAWTSRGIISARREGQGSAPSAAVPVSAPVMQPIAAAPVSKPAPAAAEARPAKQKAAVRYSPKELAEKAERSPEIAGLFEGVQAILGRPITGTETAGYLNLCEYYGFSAASILILTRFAHDLGKDRIAYIEAVAKDWFAKGITDYEDVEREIGRMTEQNKYDILIKNALGIEGKTTAKQAELFRQWHEWGFDADTVELAGEHCRDNKSKNVLGYINGILRRWHENGLMSVRAVLESEKKYKESRKKLEAEKGGDNSSLNVDKWYELAESFDPWAEVNGEGDGDK